MAKSWGSGGGILVFSREEEAERLFRLGGSLVFGGPLQPATLGACVEAAKILLSDERDELEARLRATIRHTNTVLRELRRPTVSLDETPIFFVGVGDPAHAIRLSRRLKDRGYFVNVTSFPAVPLGAAGIRFTNTVFHRKRTLRRCSAACAPSSTTSRRRMGWTWSGCGKRSAGTKRATPGWVVEHYDLQETAITST